MRLIFAGAQRADGDADHRGSYFVGFHSLPIRCASGRHLAQRFASPQDHALKLSPGPRMARRRSKTDRASQIWHSPLASGSRSKTEEPNGSATIASKAAGADGDANQDQSLPFGASLMITSLMLSPIRRSANRRPSP